MVFGSINGLILGLFFRVDFRFFNSRSSFTQIPGLILCGVWFGKIKINSPNLLGHFRYGLICSFGSFLCGTLYLFQILIKNFPDSNFLLYLPSVKNILAEVFLTGFFAPLICSKLLKLFIFSKDKSTIISIPKQ